MVSRGAALLTLGYAAVLGLGAYELQRAPSLSEAPPPPAQAAQPLPPLEIPPSAIASLAAYDAIIERPLFSPDRRPETTEAEDQSPLEDAATEEAITEIDGFRLTAVLRNGEKTTVLIEDMGGETRILHEGERLGNWRLDEIHDDRVLLAADGRRKTLMVYDFNAPPMPRAQRRIFSRTRQPPMPAVEAGQLPRAIRRMPPEPGGPAEDEGPTLRPPVIQR